MVDNKKKPNNFSTFLCESRGCLICLKLVKHGYVQWQNCSEKLSAILHNKTLHWFISRIAISFNTVAEIKVKKATDLKSIGHDYKLAWHPRWRSLNEHYLFLMLEDRIINYLQMAEFIWNRIVTMQKQSGKPSIIWHCFWVKCKWIHFLGSNSVIFIFVSCLINGNQPLKKTISSSRAPYGKDMSSGKQTRSH